MEIIAIFLIIFGIILSVLSSCYCFTPSTSPENFNVFPINVPQMVLESEQQESVFNDINNLGDLVFSLQNTNIDFPATVSVLDIKNQVIPVDQIDQTEVNQIINDIIQFINGTSYQVLIPEEFDTIKQFSTQENLRRDFVLEQKDFSTLEIIDGLKVYKIRVLLFEKNKNFGETFVFMVKIIPKEMSSNLKVLSVKIGGDNSMNFKGIPSEPLKLEEPRTILNNLHLGAPYKMEQSPETITVEDEQWFHNKIPVGSTDYKQVLSTFQK